MIGPVLGLFVCLIVLAVAFVRVRDHRDELERHLNKLRDEQHVIRESHAKEVAELARKHGAELNDLRSRCAKYAEALVTADKNAGRLPRDGFCLDLAIECVPLRITQCSR